jgi:hypothetical protein
MHIWHQYPRRQAFTAIMSKAVSDSAPDSAACQSLALILFMSRKCNKQKVEVSAF